MHRSQYELCGAGALLGLALAVILPGAASAGDADLLGLRWGASLEESTQEPVLARSHHELYGEAVDVQTLPKSLGGEIHRILYFGANDHLLRIWVNFGHPEGSLWDENYLLDEALVRYAELKKVAGADFKDARCKEPDLPREEVAGQSILSREFKRDRVVWSCNYDEGPTSLRITLRRLGDSEGKRFDVTYDAQDRKAVDAYQNENDYRPKF